MRSRRGLLACWFVLALAADPLASPDAKAARPKPVAVSGEQLQELLPGAVIHFDTPLASIVRVTYGAKGAMRGSAPNLAFYLGSSSDRGRWWVKGRKLCQKWRTWFEGKARCYRVRKRGRRIYWASNAGDTGTARIASMRTVIRKPKTGLNSSVPVKPTVPPQPNLVRTASVIERRSPPFNAFETTVEEVKQHAPVRVPKPNLAQPKVILPTRTEQEVSDTGWLLARLQSWFGILSTPSGDKTLAPSSRMALGGALPANHDQSAAASITVKVLLGDTLHGLAQKHGSTVREIMHANDMATTFLRAGQTLTIPRSGN